MQIESGNVHLRIVHLASRTYLLTRGKSVNVNTHARKFTTVLYRELSVIETCFISANLESNTSTLNAEEVTYTVKKIWLPQFANPVNQ